jgi:hypothetical protein
MHPRQRLVLAAAHIVAFAACMLVARLAIGSDGYEYGWPANLNGLTMYYVDTGTEIALRNDIAAKIGREEKRLQLADSREQGQIGIDVVGSDDDDDGAAFVVYVRAEWSDGTEWARLQIT